MKTQMLTLKLFLAGALAIAAPAAAQPAGAGQPPTVAVPSTAPIPAVSARIPATTLPPMSELRGLTDLARDWGQTVLPPMSELMGLTDLARDWGQTVLPPMSELMGLADLARDWGQTDSRPRDLAQRDKDDAQREKDRELRDREREAQYYEQGQGALDASRWDRAVSAFDRVIEMKAAKADAALYWKAYAQNKLGQRPEALSTIADLTKAYPKSRYLGDARALEVDVRRDTGSPVNPAAENDEELKIMAINSLQNSAPDEAIPMLEKVLRGTGSPKLKSQALFVLAQSSSPKAREVLVNIAKGNGNPDLQMRAVRYLGLHGNAESRAALADIYASSSDVDMKKRILQAFMVGGEKGRLLNAAQSEQNPELRAAAVQQLGVMGAHDELWALYQKESTVDVKKQIIRAMFVGGNATHLIELAKGEQNPELRLLAVRNLGLMGNKRTGDALVEIYGNDKDLDVRKAVVNALFLQQNAESLVALARKEQDPTMKKELVQKLSLIHSKVATDYLLELLSK